MNIIEAAKLLKKGKVLRSNFGYAVSVNVLGMAVNYETEEPFGFFVDELLSDAWEVTDE